MRDPKQNKHYFILSLSNFLSALGGGTILGKGIAVTTGSLFQGGSVLAWFIGIIFGLTFLELIPKKWAQALGKWFSILAALLSLLLLAIYLQYNSQGKLVHMAGGIFFLLLSLRFGFWFYSRVLRARQAAGLQQRIAWVECGYTVGMILGLLLSVGAFNLTLVSALIFDALLQVGAGVLDFSAKEDVIPSLPTAEKDKLKPKLSQMRHAKNTWCWRLAFAATLLTVGVQVIVFNLSHFVAENFAPFILAFFYLGASLAAIVGKRYQIRLEWKESFHSRFSYAAIYSKQNKPFSFLFSASLASIFVIIIILAILNWHWGRFAFQSNAVLLSFFIAAAAFFYEILLLAILDRIKIEENIHSNNMIVRTYGLMGITAAFSFWFFSATKSAAMGLSLSLLGCFLITMVAVRKRLSPAQYKNADAN